MKNFNSLIELVRDTVDKGATSVEQVQKAIMNQPLDVLDKIEGLNVHSQKVKDVQDRTIGSVYDVIRGVNNEVAKLATDVLSDKNKKSE